jgi:hypothetical protein
VSGKHERSGSLRRLCESTKSICKMCVQPAGVQSSIPAYFFECVCSYWSGSRLFSDANSMECLVRNQSYARMDTAVSMTKYEIYTRK